MATQSTVNNVKLSNASSFHHSVLLHHNDSVETPLQGSYQRSSPNSSSSTQRSQRVHLQLGGPNMSQNYLLREDSLEMPCCSTTATNSASNSARSNEDRKPRDSRRRIFGLFQKERTVRLLLGCSLDNFQKTIFFQTNWYGRLILKCSNNHLHISFQTTI